MPTRPRGNSIHYFVFIVLNVLTLGGESSCLECIFKFFSLKVSQLIEKYEIYDGVGATSIWQKKNVMLEAKITDI